MLRTNEVVCVMFGLKHGMTSLSAFSRFVCKLDIQYNDMLNPSLMCKFWSRIGMQKMTIGVDSTVIS